jgi:hypothetical protein
MKPINGLANRPLQPLGHLSGESLDDDDAIGLADEGQTRDRQGDTRYENEGELTRRRPAPSLVSRISCLVSIRLECFSELQRHLIAPIADRARADDFAQMRRRSRALQGDAARLANCQTLAQQE